MKLLLAALAIALSLTTASARAADRTPVYVNCTNEDRDVVGERLCTAMRDSFKRSPRYTLLTASSDKEMYFTVHITTITPSDTNRNASCGSVVLVLNIPKTSSSTGTIDFITNWALYTGSSRVSEQTQDLFAEIDKQINAIVSAVDGA